MSGEGPTDIADTKSAFSPQAGNQFRYGPMAVIVDRIVERHFHYSILDIGVVEFISKQELIEAGASFKAVKKSLGAPGKKRAKETRYFFNNARVLARLALQQGRERENDNVVAVLFRDADGTASSDRGVWETKWQSMLDGFQEEGFARGVPMIPKPKSEAWLICALKTHPYQNCQSLEDRSGNDDSPNNLKAELEKLIGTRPTRVNLCKLLEDRPIEVDRIEMPKFVVFRERLEYVINST